MARLEFNSAAHRYTVDGRPVPSVTQVLEAVGIIDYSFLPYRVRTMALERGRRIHEMTHFDDENELDEDSLDESLVPYLCAWRRFRTETEIGRLECSLIEHRAFHATFGYAGTLDRLFGGKVLVDIKTNGAPWWVRIQLAAYAELLYASNTVTGLVSRVSVELKDDGKFSLEPLKAADQRADFQTFLAALRVHQEQQQQRKG